MSVAALNATRLVSCLVLAGFTWTGASAQMVEKVERKQLTLAGAKAVAAAASAEARRNNAGGAIAVVDDGGHLLYLERLDGTFPAACAVAIDKARTAATFRRPTSVFEDAIRNGRTSLVAVNVMTPLQGGVPITVDGQVVGAVGVSGAASAQQDEDIAKVAAQAVR
jgi:glc operon protein GlcG